MNTDYVEAKRDKLVRKADSLIEQLNGMLAEYRNEFGQGYIDDDEHLSEIENFVNGMLSGLIG